MPSTPRFHRGYSKRVRRAFSDASESSDPEPEQDSESEQGSEQEQESSSESEQSEHEQQPPPGVAPGKTRKREPWWTPLAWIERFETTFCSPTMQIAQIANGPFAGYVPWGERAGTYMPGYGPPSDETLAEAEKIAVLRNPPYESESDLESEHEPGSTPASAPDGGSSSSSSDTDSDDADGEDADRGGEDDGVVMAQGVAAGGNTSDGESVNHDALGAPDGPPVPSSPPALERPGQTADDVVVLPSSQPTEPHQIPHTEVEAQSTSPHKDPTAERFGRLDRTAQYVLKQAAARRSSSPAPSKQDADGSPSKRKEAPLPGIPATAHSSSPTSNGVSDTTTTTSVLITRQLTQEDGGDGDNDGENDSDDSAPPSNQELAVLMSSSPAPARGGGPGHEARVSPKHVGARKKPTLPPTAAASEGGTTDYTTSSTEPSCGIPARLPETPPRPPRRQAPAATGPPATAPPRFGNRNRDCSPSPSAAFILNGISQRRSTTLMLADYRSPATVDSKPAPSTSGKRNVSMTAAISGRGDSIARKSSRLLSAPRSSAEGAVELTKSTPEKHAKPTALPAELNPPAVPAVIPQEDETGSRDEGGDDAGHALSTNGAGRTATTDDADEQPVITHPLKSFQAINDVAPSQEAAPLPGTPQRQLGSRQDAKGAEQEEEALDYVLRESPGWLRSITEVGTSSRPTNPRRWWHRARAETSPTAPAARTQHDTTSASDGPSDDEEADNGVDTVEKSGEKTAPNSVPLPPVKFACAVAARPQEKEEEAPVPQSKKRKRAPTAGEDAALRVDPLVRLSLCDAPPSPLYQGERSGDLTEANRGRQPDNEAKVEVEKEVTTEVSGRGKKQKRKAKHTTNAPPPQNPSVSHDAARNPDSGSRDDNDDKKASPSKKKGPVGAGQKRKRCASWQEATQQPAEGGGGRNKSGRGTTKKGKKGKKAKRNAGAGTSGGGRGDVDPEGPPAKKQKRRHGPENKADAKNWLRQGGRKKQGHPGQDAPGADMHHDRGGEPDPGHVNVNSHSGKTTEGLPALPPTQGLTMPGNDVNGANGKDGVKLNRKQRRKLERERTLMQMKQQEQQHDVQDNGEPSHHTPTSTIPMPLNGSSFTKTVAATLSGPPLNTDANADMPSCGDDDGDHTHASPQSKPKSESKSKSKSSKKEKKSARHSRARANSVSAPKTARDESRNRARSTMITPPATSSRPSSPGSSRGGVSVLGGDGVIPPVGV